MPPKAKKGKDKKKKKEPEEKPKTPEPSAKELMLQDELKEVTKELETAKAKVIELQQHNEWLLQKGQSIRVHNHEYMSYLDKKTSKRRSAIVTLSDFNREEIRNIKLQCQAMEEDYDEKMNASQAVLLEKLQTLEEIKEEYVELQEYKILKKEQEARILDLERQMNTLRAHNTRTLQQLKNDFFSEMTKHQLDSETCIEFLEKKALKEARQCLLGYTSQMKLENQSLRRELQALIQQSRALAEHQRELEDQRKQLIKEHSHAVDVKKLREKPLNFKSPAALHSPPN